LDFEKAAMLMIRFNAELESQSFPDKSIAEN